MFIFIRNNDGIKNYLIPQYSLIDLLNCITLSSLFTITSSTGNSIRESFIAFCFHITNIGINEQI